MKDQSPCMGRCDVDESGCCKGCARTLLEIELWSVLDSRSKKLLLQTLEHRRKNRRGVESAHAEVATMIALQAARSLEMGRVQALSGGVDAAVYEGFSDRIGRAVFKVFMPPVVSHPNLSSASPVEIARSESSAQQAAKQAQVPTADSYQIITIGPVAIHVQQYVEGDVSSVDAAPETLGRVIRRLHDHSQLPECLVGMEADTLAETLANRTTLRIDYLVTQLGRRRVPKVRKNLLYDLFGSQKTRCLLHMDLRANNILHRREQISAVLDWGNALVGPPALEFARMLEYGTLSNDFIAGYGWNPIDQLPNGVLDAYRLDTLAMLGVVFLVESPNSSSLDEVLRRISDTSRRLGGVL